MRAYERFITYARIHTASSEDFVNNPSTERQFDLARLLVKELRDLGVQDARLTDTCYVYGSLPATPGYEDRPKLGFIAHMDTIPDFSGENVKPTLVHDYDGGDIPLGDSGRVLSPKDFPSLLELKGKTLITTDGTTVLGGDDKAGVAEIMTLVERLQQGDIPHGFIGVAFTPDEEIGHGPDGFDVKGFGCDFGYTMDGGKAGEIEFENFNACAAKVTIHGRNVHPGSAKGVMINALQVAMELNGLLPGAERPEHTDMYEGFFHLNSLEGSVEKATLSYIVRDHSAPRFDSRKATLRQIEAFLNEKYGPGTVEIALRDQYRNMVEKIRPDNYHLIENAIAACEQAGVKPLIQPIRGGTDGATLSFMGLPCPNLGTGGYACHGPFEHVCVEEMDQCVEVALNLVKAYAR